MLETIAVTAILLFTGVIMAVSLYRLFTGKTKTGGCAGGCAGCRHASDLCGDRDREPGRDAVEKASR